MLEAQLKNGMATLLRLRAELIEAEEAYNAARKAFEDYSREILPSIMKQNEVYSVTTKDGLVANLVTKTHVNVTKSKVNNVCDWLTAHGGGFLVKEDYIVPKDVAEHLMLTGIPCEKITNVNTNSLKSFLLDKLGQRTGPKTLDIGEIPDGINFFQYDEVEFRK